MKLIFSGTLSINKTLVLSHLTMVLILIIGLSISRFKVEWDLHVKHASELAENSLLHHVDELSLLVAGRNYSTIMLPSRLEELYAHQVLLFLDIKGRSDHQSKLVHVRYLREGKKIWREDIRWQDVEQLLETKLHYEKRLHQIAKDDTTQYVKLEYIVNKATLDYRQGVQSLQQSKYFHEQGKFFIDPNKSYYFDASRQHLHMKLPLTNSQGGQLWGVFNVKQLSSIHKQLLQDIILEALIALAVSFLLILIVTQKLVQPIKALSAHMSEELDKIDIEQIQERHRKDEIGDLAKTFIQLIYQIKSKVTDLKEKSNTDPLTQLGSRHKYSYQAEHLLKASLLTGKSFAFLICDIDKFKTFNDSYGHQAGDLVIIQVAKAIQSVLTSGDKCYRIGGDEFVILFPEYTNNQHIEKAQQIRQTVHQLNSEQLDIDNIEYKIQHMVSVSLGMCFIEASDSYMDLDLSCVFNELFNKADQQLYLAKSKGRNTLVTAKFTPRCAKNRG